MDTKPSTPAATYAFLYPVLVKAAREKGYALALHGSLMRDLDLVAVPWTEESAPAEDLVEALREKCGGFLIPREDGGEWPRPKPHGRRCWSIQLPRMAYIDLSVMPRTAK